MLRALAIRFVFSGAAPVHVNQHIRLREVHGFPWTGLLLIFEQRPAQQRQFLQRDVMLHQQPHVCRHRELSPAMIPRHALEREAADVGFLPESR